MTEWTFEMLRGAGTRPVAVNIPYTVRSCTQYTACVCVYKLVAL